MTSTFSQSTQPIHTIAIIGGGICGMAAAYAVQQQARKDEIPVRCVLFESEARLGGKILTHYRDDFIIEGGPDSVFNQKPWAVQLAQQLGMEADIVGSNPDEKRLYVVNRGKLTQMPDGVMLIIPTRFMPFITSNLISWPGKIRMGMDLFIPRRPGDDDESLADFIRRRLGNEALEKIAEPLLSGIHVSDPEKQSLLGTFPRFRNIEKEHGSLVRGMLAQQRAARRKPAAPRPDTAQPAWKRSAFVTFRGGMAQFVQRLEEALDGVEIYRGQAVTGLSPRPDGGYRLTTAGEESILADEVILATPAFVSADLLASCAPDLSRRLSAIRYVSTATVSLAYPTGVVGENPLRGIGFIVPRKENRRVSACTMSSIKFAPRAPQGQVLLRCFVGGPGKEELAERPDDEAIIADVKAELADLLGIHSEPTLASVSRWVKGNAQYDVGHLERIRELRSACDAYPGLILAGAAFDGIGVPDCIHQGQEAAEQALAHLPQLETL